MSKKELNIIKEGLEALQAHLAIQYKEQSLPCSVIDEKLYIITDLKKKLNLSVFG